MLNFDCGIYTITSPSGKQYVGSSRSIKTRWRTHKRDLEMGRHHCAALQRACNKYGLTALVFAKVAAVPADDLTWREQEQMDARRAVLGGLYNSYPQAGGTAGRVLSPETMERTKISLKRALANPTVKAAMSAAKLGKPRTDEARAKQSATTRGRKTPANRSGFSGVWVLPGGRWRARARSPEGKCVHVGVYDTPEEANAANLHYLTTGVKL